MEIGTKIKECIAIGVKTNDIKVMIDTNMKLAGYMYYLQEQEVKAYHAKIRSHEARKDFEAKFFLAHDGTVAHKEREAFSKSKSLRDAELEADVWHYSLQSMRRTTSQYIDMLKQRIAQARSEWDLTKAQV